MKNSLLILFVGLCFYSLKLQAAQFKCSEGTVEIPIGPEEKENEKTSVCYKEDPLMVISKSCMDGKCEAMTRPYPLKKEQKKFSAIGTPGSGMCTRLGGHAQVVTFRVDEKTIELDRCLFKDGSYMDLGNFWRYMVFSPELREKFLK